MLSFGLAATTVFLRCCKLLRRTSCYIRAGADRGRAFATGALRALNGHGNGQQAKGHLSSVTQPSICPETRLLQQSSDRALAKPADRAVAHIVGPSDVGQHLASFPASDCFSPLLASQLRFPTKNYPPRLRTLAPLAGPRPDKFALELGETAQNGQHQATMRRCGVSPSIS